MANENGKIKRPYNYILPGYAAPVFVTFLLLGSFVLTNNGKNVYYKKSLFF